MSDADLGGLSILIVEDESLLRKQLSARLTQLGADASGVGTLKEARQRLSDLNFDFMMLDVNLPDGLGTDLLKARDLPAGTSVIVMTAHGGVGGAVEAMRLGAVDYLVKPFDAEELPLVIARARRIRQTARLNEHRRADIGQSGGDFFFGSSLAELKTLLDKILAADERVRTPLAPVLIEGETGTGKTTIARWLHHRGPRAAQPLVEVNCPALPDTLAESELFGHERGAFTDARTARIGLFEAANGGTLFLDELPSLSLSLQAKVLKVIEDHRIRRLGGNKEIPIDVRVIAATNRDLRERVTAGEFREDLLQRLDMFRVRIAPLRERGADILKLAEQLMERICRRHRLPQRTISSEGRERLASHPWNGNVRELSHELERAVVFEEGEVLHFPRLAGGTSGASADTNDWFNAGFKFPAQGFDLEGAINRLIHHALKQTDKNVSAAARLLGVPRDYVRYRLSGEKDSQQRGK